MSATAELFQAAQALQIASRAAQKSVSVNMSKDTLVDLKSNRLHMCFAKKVGDSFNVIWKSEQRFLVNTTFSWVPTYALFATNRFEEQVVVDVSTSQVDCGLGETCTMDQHGVMNGPVTGGPETSLTLINDFGLTHAGVSQVCIGPDGKLERNVIYVDELETPLGSVELTPVEEVLIWFEREAKTGTMFSRSKSKSVVVDLTHKNTQELEYSITNGWKKLA